MKLVRLLSVLCFLTFAFACGDGNNESGESTSESGNAAQNAGSSENEVHGKEIKAGDITITNPLNAQWVADGKEIYDVKCQACHKLTDERLVGPGWKGVTKRRELHWIMNMVTNVDMMLEKDPEAQKLLEQCLVRMPNQNLSTDQARHVLEFMRSNDGQK
jgi:mono/diheme cytochrome c family protein